MYVVVSMRIQRRSSSGSRCVITWCGVSPSPTVILIVGAIVRIICASVSAACISRSYEYTAGRTGVM